MKRSTSLTPRVEGLEEKQMLSGVPFGFGPAGFLPVTSFNTYNNVQHQIDQAAGTYAKTHNAFEFDEELQEISSRLPFGFANLYPTLRADEAIYNPAVFHSGRQMVARMHTDVANYFFSGINNTFYVR